MDSFKVAKAVHCYKELLVGGIEHIVARGYEWEESNTLYQGVIGERSRTHCIKRLLVEGDDFSL